MEAVPPGQQPTRDDAHRDLERQRQRAAQQPGPSRHGAALSVGAALAAAHFSQLAAVPSAIFSVWHNISGGLVATWFQRGENSLEDERMEPSTGTGVGA